MALHTMIENLNRARRELDLKAREEITKALIPLIPEGMTLVWEQYTDYWNDGEPCTFNVHDPMLFDGSRTHEICWGEPDSWDHFGIHEHHVESIRDAFKALPNDLMLAAFGDHVTVRLTSESSVEILDNTNHD